MNTSYNEPPSAKRNLSNKRINLTPKVGLGREAVNTGIQTWRPMSAKAKASPTLFMSMNRPRPNSSTRTKVSNSSFDLDKAMNTSRSKQSQRISTPANNLPSPSSQILKARLSNPNLTQRKPSDGKISAQPPKEKQSKSAINRSFPSKDKKIIPNQAAIIQSASDKDRDLFAIAETDKVHESEYAMNQAKHRAKQSQTENPLLKKPALKTNKSAAVLKPATLNNKSSSLKKDQPPPQPRKGLNTTILNKPVVQRGKSITSQPSTKDPKTSNPSTPRATPFSAKRVTPRQHSATNSTLASPRVLDTPIERPKPQLKANSFFVSTAIIEALSAKETNSTDNSVQKSEEQAPRVSNVSNKKRIFEIMSQACD